MLSQIEEVRRTRAVQRAARKRCGGSNGQGLATVAVVGYTNAVGGQNENVIVFYLLQQNEHNMVSCFLTGEIYVG